MRLRSPMPDIQGETDWLNGKVRREDLIGERPTIIHFWSVSCYDCKESLPEFGKFREKYSDQVNFLAVHMPRSNEDMDITTIKKVARKYKITQPIFIDNKMKLNDAFNNQYVPSYFVFDKKGILRHYQAGGSGMKMLEKRLLKIL
ncbi:TlpA family protein disulfide reductase [Ureibacillus chungkukjangi]|uniref:Thiol-disulfide isomerase/thioredoxin n=1 Tax=Ureibacillus chungkukjangi TaxID=1202712 RepID=A0A318TTS9_9BACL|nr:TlpA disulfide reductase family protein [Ureibacillus chungkukjangi]PYF06468.1 thiol-disulfide isomerase/thioredoxin [Ureibacillus chungkukjangi]